MWSAIAGELNYARETFELASYAILTGQFNQMDYTQPFHNGLNDHIPLIKLYGLLNAIYCSLCFCFLLPATAWHCEVSHRINAGESDAFRLVP